MDLMEWVAALVAAIVSLTAAGFSAFATRAARRMPREFVAVAQDGARESVMVEPDSSPDEIKRSIKDAFEFEDEVQRILEELNYPANRGKYVDFLVQAEGRIIGVEVKSSLERIRPSAVLRYFKEWPEVQKVVIVTKTFPDKLPDRSIRKLVHQGRLALIAAADESSLTDRLRQELRKSDQAHFVPSPM